MLALALLGNDALQNAFRSYEEAKLKTGTNTWLARGD